MKRSELAEYIKETIVDVLQEATIETSPEDLSKVKQAADKDDVINAKNNLKKSKRKQGNDTFRGK